MDELAPQSINMDRAIGKERAYYKERAYQILSGREHSAWELCQKLIRKGCAAELATDIVADLSAMNLVDDIRFGLILVRSKLGQGWGRLRIVTELRSRGVQGDDLEAVLAQSAEDFLPEREEERAAEIVSRRLHSSADVDKVMRYLVSHGFSSSCARRALEPYRQEWE